jgi:DNA-binding transcriptional LysR family regulator
MLDLKLLRQAVVLAKHRNFARAAEALHLTQPALSRSIAGLEAAVGAKLFNRTKQGVEPTAFGELLLSRGGALLDGARELERSIALMRGLDIGELRVGAGPYPSELSVGKAVGRLMMRHPKLRVEVATSDLRTMVGDLLAGKLDLAVVEMSLATDEPRLAVEQLPEHPAPFYCRAGHPLCDEADPSLERIMEFPFVGTRLPARVAQTFLQLAKVGAIDPDNGDYLPPVKTDTLQAARDVVLASDAVSAAPLSLIARDIQAGRLSSLRLRAAWLRTSYGFVYRRDRLLSPAAEAFIAEVRAVETDLAREELQVSGVVGSTSTMSEAQRP